MEYIQFGRSLVESKPDLLFYQFVNECITEFDLNADNADLLCDLANAAGIPQMHITPLTMLIGNKVIKRVSPTNAFEFLKLIGLEDHEIRCSFQGALYSVLLTWSGVIKCFAYANTAKDVIGHAALIQLGYDAYKQELVVKKHQEELLEAKKMIIQLEDNLANEKMVKLEYGQPRYEWDDFLGQMIRVDHM